MNLCVGFPNVPNNDDMYRAIDDILGSHRLTNNGIYVRELEDKMSEFLEVKNVVAVCNATIGLQIVAKALELTGKVIMPSFTFVATAHAMEWIGLEPVFCDVTEDHLVSPTSVDRMIDDSVSAILGVHLWGDYCPTTALALIAYRKEINIFYDAAHAFGCTRSKRGIGNFGDAAVFSLHATKCINSFEGGLITTGSDELAEKCRRMRNFGFVDYDSVQSFGTNGKMSEIHAAMGLAMLKLYPSIVAANKERFDLYFERLSPLPGIFVLEPNQYEDRNYQYVVIEVREGMTGISRDKVLEKLHSVGILARRYFYPGIHRMPPYASGQILPITERLCNEVLVLPTGPSLTMSDVVRVCDTIEGTLL